jgi:hypothetical protein
VKVPYTLPSCLGLSSVLSHNIITLTWTTTILLILHNAIQINLQINVLFVVGIRRITLKTGKSRKCYSILGRNKNFLFPLSFPQEARLALGIVQPPIQCVRTVLPWKLSGRDMMITTQFNTLPRLRVDGVIPTLPYMPEWSTHKKIVFTLPLRLIENDLFLMDSGYTVRIEAVVHFIFLSAVYHPVTQTFLSVFIRFYPPGSSLSSHFL